jgi:hypothetical protein
MTDISNWNFYYKMTDKNPKSTSNLMYTPLINPEGNIMCMLWDEKSSYQKNNKNLTKDLIDFFFVRELKYINIFQKYNWAPRLLDVEDNKIFIEFSENSMNKIQYSGEKLIPSWKEQLFQILKDIDDAGYYKMSLYPHCFYIVDDTIRTIDFYACIEKNDCFIQRNKIEGMIGSDSTGRFDGSTIGDKIDFRIFIKKTMCEHLASVWNDNPFPEFYKRLYD